MSQLVVGGLIFVLLSVVPYTPATAMASAIPEQSGLGRIWGLIYWDANDDGQYIPGEALVEGARVELWQSGQKIHEWTTDTDGVFLFDNLEPGAYTVVETPPPGWTAPNNTFAVQVVAGQTREIFIPNYRLVATLTVNYTVGAPGSFFTVRGMHFPPNATGTVQVNGHVLGIIPTDANGEFLFLLNTQGAYSGRYIVTAEVNPLGRVFFSLDHDSPLRPKEDEGPVFRVPPAIALLTSFYLPLHLHQ